jgi:hypothetical protein
MNPSKISGDTKNIEHVETLGAHFLPRVIEAQKQFDEIEKELDEFRKKMGPNSIWVRKLEQQLLEATEKKRIMENKVFYQK